MCSYKEMCHRDKATQMQILDFGTPPCYFSVSNVMKTILRILVPGQICISSIPQLTEQKDGNSRNYGPSEAGRGFRGCVDEGLCGTDEQSKPASHG